MIQSFDGNAPQVDAAAWVHETAVVIGEVMLAEGVSIWPTAVLRGDMGPIRIGAWTNIQDGAVCHDTTARSQTVVGPRCTIGHRAILHGCVLEEEVLVGMGAIVMDNVRVGRRSIVGAGAVLPAGKVIPPGSLVLGVPGRVVRALSVSEQERIDHGWRTYAATMQRWRGAERA